MQPESILHEPIFSPENFSGLGLKVRGEGLISRDGVHIPIGTEIKPEGTISIGPFIEIGSKYLLVFSCIEHPRGATQYGHCIDILDSKANHIYKLPAETSLQAIEVCSRANVQSIALLTYKTNRFFYHTLTNAEKPALDIIVLSLSPRCEETKRITVDLPKGTQKHYNNTIKYIDARFASMQKGIVVACKALRDDTTADLEFSFPVDKL